MKKILFTPDGEEEVAFYILEQTKIGGCNYILVTDSEEEEDGEAFIMKEIQATNENESLYEIVEDDTELNAVASVFSNLLDDIDLIGE